MKGEKAHLSRACPVAARDSKSMPSPAISGFTLIELVLVLVLLGILAAAAIPRFVDLRQEARFAKLQDVSRVMHSTINIVRSKAAASGLTIADSNPGGSNQNGFEVDFGFGTTEVDWRNLCPESRAEVGDALTMLDFLSIDDSDTNFQTNVTNRSTRVGFDLNTCYVEYDSFACDVTIVDTDCG